MFYVSVINDSGDYRLLAGPFLTHSQALAMVDPARKAAEQYDPRAFWYAYGTCRVPDHNAPGLLNNQLGIEG